MNSIKFTRKVIIFKTYVILTTGTLPLRSLSQTRYRLGSSIHPLQHISQVNTSALPHTITWDYQTECSDNRDYTALEFATRVNMKLLLGEL
jgi:hypothetical protein